MPFHLQDVWFWVCQFSCYLLPHIKLKIKVCLCKMSSKNIPNTRGMARMQNRADAQSVCDLQSTLVLVVLHYIRSASLSESAEGLFMYRAGICPLSVWGLVRPAVTMPPWLKVLCWSALCWVQDMAQSRQMRTQDTRLRQCLNPQQACSTVASDLEVE